MRARMVLFALLVLFLGSAPARAFHLIKIVEVFPGTQASPSAQFVVLQAFATGQNTVSGQSVTVFNAAGTSIGTFVFPANVPNGANQAKILIATPQAASFFGVFPDLTMTAIIPPSGGKICYGSFDCVAWGIYSGSSAGVGPPFNATGVGLRSGVAIRRNLGGNGTLDAIDDTDNCAVDFAFGQPAPRNNNGANGTIPPSICGNSALEGLEYCDDGNTNPGDGCRGDCRGSEICGDQLVDMNEACDDGNASNNDACPTTCFPATCGDGFIFNTQGGTEQCDDANASNNDACLNSCALATCGDGFTWNTQGGTEQCDDANVSNNDACLTDCALATCGDGFIRNTQGGTEQCDDANLNNNDACPGTCLLATCGDGFIFNTQGGTEQCDDANLSNNDACLSSCALAICGDGFIFNTQGGTEQCDDANSNNNAACPGTCFPATCGDGFIWNTQGGTEECDDDNTSPGDGCSSDCLSEETAGEASPNSLYAAPGLGTDVDIEYTPACGATNHGVYWGTGPFLGGIVWQGSGCGLGTSGAATFDPGAVMPGQLRYFVIVGYTSWAEGSYGRNSSGLERPEATGVGSCNRPFMLGTCP